MMSDPLLSVEGEKVSVIDVAVAVLNTGAGGL